MNLVFRTSLLLLVLLAAGCGSQTPTAPATGPLSLPGILSITPASLKVAVAAQTLTINGSNLQTVTQVVVVGPTGAVRTFSGATILKLTTTSFEISIALGEAGQYRLAIIAGTSESANSTFTVSA